jgi:hypothetical protein
MEYFLIVEFAGYNVGYVKLVNTNKARSRKLLEKVYDAFSPCSFSAVPLPVEVPVPYLLYKLPPIEYQMPVGSIGNNLFLSTTITNGDLVVALFKRPGQMSISDFIELRKNFRIDAEAE